MKKQALNPYLPLDTYIPDGEPHIFGDRLYIFGSHDKELGETFCMLDYECWSAPVEDLSDWCCEGTIYRAEQDPSRCEKYQYLYAPDVVRGNDGRYYLYYALAYTAFTGPIHVAVCDTPAGKYEYYGEVRNPDGTTYDRYTTFDPAVINDNGRVFLYHGWALGAEQFDNMSPFARNTMKKLFMPAVECRMFDKTRRQIRRDGGSAAGAYAVELADDMLTVKTEPKRIVPGQMDSYGTDFEKHAFFEGSSIRKLGDTYYFIYSSQVCHELCYATSRYPDRDFRFGGVIISNGDIGYRGRKPEDRLTMTGNNHGSIENLNGDWYIFYHRQTNKSTFSRQGCAEKIRILPNGSIPQVEMTSCGLNDGPLIAKGIYPAPLCCNLTNGHMPVTTNGRLKETVPHITCRDGERIITEFGDGCLAGFKYFLFPGKVSLTVRAKGTGSGILSVRTDEGVLGEMPVTPSEEWKDHKIIIHAAGSHALYLSFKGSGLIDILEIEFGGGE